MIRTRPLTPFHAALAPGMLVTALALVMLASAPETARAAAADKTAAKAAEKKSDPAHDAMMAEMMKLATPGAKHGALRALQGTWKTVTKSWDGPGEPTITEGTSEHRMVMGGRYLEQRMKGTVWGQPFEGYGLTGYDNRKNEYVVMWVDNTTTWITTGSGHMDEAGKELIVKASDLGPDGKPVEYRMVTRLVDANRHVFSMSTIAAGQEQLIMEITYTRM